MIDTKGINVWCAAGKGTFGTQELVNRIGQTELKNIVAFDRQYDIVFKPSLNLWNGKENLQLVIEDMKESEIE